MRCRPALTALSLALLLAALVPAAAEARLLVVPLTAPGSTGLVRFVDVDTAQTVGDPIALPGPAHAAVFSPDGAKAYVAHDRTPAGAAGDVAVIDVATRTIERTIVDVGATVFGLALAPSGTRLHVLSFRDQTLKTFDVASGTAVGEPIALAGQPQGILISPDGTRAHLTEPQNARIRTFDLLTGAEPVTSINVGIFARDLVFGASPSVAYVFNDGFGMTPGGVRSTDLVARTAAPAYAGIDKVSHMAGTPAGDRLVLTRSQTPRITTFAVPEGPGATPPTRPLPNAPLGVAVAPDGQRAYAVTGGDGSTVGPALHAFELPALTPVGAAVPLTPTTAQSFNLSVPAIQPLQGPVASFSVTPAASGAATAFDASASSAEAGIARYDWDFGDGTTLQAGPPNPKHTYAQPGAYVVTLKLTDGRGTSDLSSFTGRQVQVNGARAATSQTVTIVAPPAPEEPPVDTTPVLTVAPPGPGTTTTAPPALTPRPPAPTVRLSGLRLSRDGRRATAALRCSAACTGTATVRAATARGPRGATLGRATVRGRPDATTAVSVRIPARAVRVVRRAGRLQLRVELRAAGQTVRRVATLRVARR